jgi:polar amino acid transport system substrate-binding protein
LLASSFTLERLQSRIGGPEYLAIVRVGVKAASTASDYLDAKGISYRSFADPDALLTALESGLIDARWVTIRF